MFKLLMVCTDFPPEHGGISTYSLVLATALSKSCRVTVLSLGASGITPFDESCSFRVIRTPSVPFLRTVALIIYLPYLLMQSRFDAVLHTVWPTSLISHFYSWVFPVPYFISVYASEMLDDKRTWRRRLKASLRRWRLAAFDRAAAIFPVSHFGANLVRSFGLAQEKILMVPIGVDPQRFKPDPRPKDGGRPKRILTVARLDLHKGHDRSLEALALVKSMGLDFEYLIVGKGDEENRLRQITKRLGLEEKVRFAGYLPDDELPGAYAGADFFLMASREIPGRLDLIEGFGISFLEASASGLPVIAGRSGGVVDAVRHGETGILVSADDPKEIAEAIRLLLTDPQVCRRLGSEGRRWALGQMNCENTAKRMLGRMQFFSCDKRRILGSTGHVRNLRNH